MALPAGPMGTTDPGDPPYIPGADPYPPPPAGLVGTPAGPGHIPAGHANDPSLSPNQPGTPWPNTPAGWAGWYAYTNATNPGGTGYTGGGTGGRRGGGGGGGSGTSKKDRAKVLAASISDRAKQLGLSFSTEEIANIAKWAVDKNWDQTVIDDALLVGVDWNKVTGGDLTAGADMMKAMGANYMIPVTTDQAHDWSLRIAKGELTQQGVDSMLQQQARARFSWMGDLIDQGVKPSDYFAPVKNMIANTLEVTPDSIDLMDPKWIGLAEVRDPKTGQTRAATLNEAMLAARKKPEWQNTRNAQEYAAQAGQMLGNIFGRAS